jgi:hypothetical protein
MIKIIDIRTRHHLRDMKMWPSVTFAHKTQMSVSQHNAIVGRNRRSCKNKSKFNYTHASLKCLPNSLVKSMPHSTSNPIIELRLTRLREQTTFYLLLVSRRLLLLASLLCCLSPRFGCSLHLLSVPNEPAERRVTKTSSSMSSS